MKVGFVGWRGMVGSVLMQRMQEEQDFKHIPESVFFTTSNVGGTAPDFGQTEKTLLDANNITELAKMDIIVTCQGGDYTKAVFEPLRASGWNGYWIDAAASNASAVDVTEAPVPATVDYLVIRNKSGVDVTDSVLRGAGGIQIQPAEGLELLERAHTIIVPGWRGIDAPVPEPLSQALRQAGRAGECHLFARNQLMLTARRAAAAGAGVSASAAAAGEQHGGRRHAGDECSARNPSHGCLLHLSARLCADGSGRTTQVQRRPEAADASLGH